MSDSTTEPGDVPTESPDTFLAGSEPISDDEDIENEGSQTLLPSDLGEPAEFNGTSGE